MNSLLFALGFLTSIPVRTPVPQPGELGRAGAWFPLVGSIIGAILGGVIGGAMEEGATQRQGVEITVRMDSGALVAVVQDAEEPRFKPGDRVRVLSDGVMTRVTR